MGDAPPRLLQPLHQGMVPTSPQDMRNSPPFPPPPEGDHTLLGALCRDPTEASLGRRPWDGSGVASKQGFLKLPCTACPPRPRSFPVGWWLHTQLSKEKQPFVFSLLGLDKVVPKTAALCPKVV